MIVDRDQTELRPWEKTAGILMLVVMILITMWGLTSMRPPKAVGVDAPDTEFSSGRAMEHLNDLAEFPHPVGTAEHDLVRDLIVDKVEQMGFTPELQETAVVRMRSARRVRAATITNILLRLPGTNNSKAVLLMAHYDTVPNAPGATDDGSGVVAMLETLRALKASPQLMNDVILLWTDAEEIGLMGAKAFVDEHPWAKDVGVVLNFEGSGSSGQSLMFETSDQNGWLIKEFAKGSKYPSANSLSYEIYRNMPNDTDLTMFKQKGISGLNFAYIDDRYDYHTASDNLENIDERSVQHHGEYALSLTRHLGNLDLEQTKESNHIYFNSVGFGFVHYPQSWALPLAVFAGILFIIALIIGFKNHRLKVFSVLFGIFAFIVNLVLAPALIMTIAKIIDKSFSGSRWWLLFYNNKPLLLGYALISLGVSIALYRLLIRGLRWWKALILLGVVTGILILGKLFTWLIFAGTVVVCALLFFMFRIGRDAASLGAGATFIWVGLTVAISIILPGGSYLILWPLLFTLVAMIISFSITRDRIGAWVEAGIHTVYAAPLLLWFPGLILLFFLSMGVGMAAYTMLALTLAIGLVIPHIGFISRIDRWIIPVLAILIGTITLFSTLRSADFDSRYRLPSALMYGVDGDQENTMWFSFTDYQDDWLDRYFTSQTDTADFGDLFNYYSEPIKTSPAPEGGILPPSIEILGDRRDNDVRFIQLKISNENKVSAFNIFLPPDHEIIDAEFNGIRIDSIDKVERGESKRWWNWSYFAPPPEGLELVLRTASEKPVTIEVNALDFHLPKSEEFKFIPRPDHMMPGVFGYSDISVAKKTFTF